MRSENAQKDYIISDCRLSKLIAAVAVKNKDDILENNIDFQVENADADVCTDSKWLEFILNQIISNSIKYRDEKKADGSVIKIYVIKNIMDTLTSVVGMESFRKLFFVSFYNINWGQNHFAPNIIEYS